MLSWMLSCSTDYASEMTDFVFPLWLMGVSHCVIVCLFSRRVEKSKGSRQQKPNQLSVGDHHTYYCMKYAFRRLVMNKICFASHNNSFCHKKKIIAVCQDTLWCALREDGSYVLMQEKVFLESNQVLNSSQDGHETIFHKLYPLALHLETVSKVEHEGITDHQHLQSPPGLCPSISYHTGKGKCDM